MLLGADRKSGGEETKAARFDEEEGACEGDAPPVFLQYCGQGRRSMDCKSLVKLCKDCGLIDKKLQTSDVDLIFAKMVPKGKRRIDCAKFQEMLRAIAAKRGIKACELEELIVEASPPVLTGTKADNVRLHDDKSTYTGVRGTMVAQTDGAVEDAMAALGGGNKKVRRPPAAAEQITMVKLADSKPKSVEDVFKAFCGTQQTLDGRGFVKLCRDCKILDKHFTASDADLAFSSVCEKGQRRITQKQFEDAIWQASEKKGADYGDLLDKILKQGGPVLTATHADAVRFHDDKGTYTGSHAGGGRTSPELSHAGRKIITG